MHFSSQFLHSLHFFYLLSVSYWLLTVDRWSLIHEPLPIDTHVARRFQCPAVFGAESLPRELFELTELEAPPIEFDEKLWHDVVDRVTVYNDDRLVYSLKDGSEITVMLWERIEKSPNGTKGDAVRGFAYSLLFVVIVAIPILIIIGIALIGMVVIVGLICRVVRIVLVCIVIKLWLRVGMSRYSVTLSHSVVLLSDRLVDLIYCLHINHKRWVISISTAEVEIFQLFVCISDFIPHPKLF